MEKRAFRISVLILVCLGMTVFGQEIKKYRGAKLDTAATDDARRVAAAEPGLEVSVYTTPDAYEKVFAYYKENAREFAMPGRRVRKLPNGVLMFDAFFILDDAKDLNASRAWVKIQRPFIGNGVVRGSNGSEIKDITAIIISQRK